MLAEVLALYMIWITVKTQKTTDVQGRLILSEPQWLQVDDWLIYK